MLPYLKFCLVSPLSIEELHDALARQIAEKGFWLIKGPDKPFRGAVDSDGFELRWIGPTRGHVSTIRGQFKQSGSGTIVDVSQRPTIFFTAYAIIWLSLLAIFAFAVPDAATTSPPDASMPPLEIFYAFPAIMALMGAFIFLRVFWDDARVTKPFLTLLFSAAEVRA